jgi:hypothetical protein
MPNSLPGCAAIHGQAWLNIPNTAGSGAGSAVTTVVSLPALSLPATNQFMVLCESQQASVVCNVVSKSHAGFSVVATPPAGTTIAANSINALVVW